LANIFLNIEKGVEVAAEDVLHFIAGAEKVLALAPAELAAIGAVLGAVDKAVTDASAAATEGFINVPLDITVFTDLKTVWTSIQAAFTKAGVNITAKTGASAPVA
jgi:hypothetical protein